MNHSIFTFTAQKYSARNPLELNEIIAYLEKPDIDRLEIIKHLIQTVPIETLKFEFLYDCIFNCSRISNSILFVAIFCGNLEIFKEICKREIDFNVVERNETLLMAVLAQNSFDSYFDPSVNAIQIEMLEFLLEKDIDVNYIHRYTFPRDDHVDDFFETLLCRVMENEFDMRRFVDEDAKIRILEKLFKKGADPNLSIWPNESVFSNEIDGMTFEELKLFKIYHANPFMEDKYGHRPLDTICRDRYKNEDYSEMAVYLIEWMFELKNQTKEIN